MEVKVILFGKLVEITGLATFTFSNVADTAELTGELLSRYPALSDYPYMIAVEKEIIHTNTSLKNNDTVALLPPYAGG